MSRFVLVSVLAVSPWAACSLALDTSVDGLLCSDQQCQKDYTCRFDQCIKNNSVPEGETCSLTTQCRSGLACPRGLDTCQKQCAKIYDAPAAGGECGADMVCVPVADTSPGDSGQGNTSRFLGGACVPTECSGDAAAANAKCVAEGGRFAPAREGNQCIRLASNGGLCLLSCQIGIRKVESPSKGTDDCLADSLGNPAHCGVVPSLDRICVPAGASKEGDDCSLYPLSGQSTPGSCGLNVVNGIPGLPLVCASPKGTVNASDGKVRCRVAQCTSKPGDCPNGQVCAVENPNVVVCKYPTE